jgi:4-hydroxythreonine-4-phosphate dehydrogenase
MLTAPVNKHNIPLEGAVFTGHTEFLANEFGAQEHLMFLLSQDIKVGLVTGHVPVKEVSQKLSVERIVSKLRLMKRSLMEDFGIIKPRIAVLGLNPHAGDNSLIGNEDKEIIAAAIQKAQNESIVAFGPYPADGFFGSRQYRSFDAVLAMYHDQGLIPFKYIAFEDGVNYTAGLPFVRTSPDHGTAYNLSGKNQASETSFRNALYAAVDIFRHRKNTAEIEANPLPFTPLRRDRFRIDF